MRILAAVRQSPRGSAARQDSESPERQLENIKLYAKSHGHQVTATAEDVDISAGISPFLRPALGPYFRDKQNEWDALCFAKLDRVVRSVMDFEQLAKWMKEHGKVLICLDPPLDLTTDFGIAFAQIIAVFAQLERAMIRNRTKQAYDALQQSGRYTGGSIVFGYRPVKLDRGSGYEIDPEYAPIVKEAATRYLSGQSLYTIAKWLNDSGVPTPRNVDRIRAGKPVQPATWNHEQVRKMLRNPAILGYATSNNEILRDADGLPVQRCEGIVERATWDKLCKIGSGPRGSNVNASALLQVAFCAICGAPMYATNEHHKKSGKNYQYYRCGNHASVTSRCDARMVSRPVLEQVIHNALINSAGDVPMRVKVVTPAEDHQTELATVDEAIGNLMADRYERNLFTGDDGAERYAAMMSKLEARQASLRALPSRPEQTTWELTGQTFAAHWESLTEPQRHAFMVQAGIRVYAQRWDGPDDESGFSPLDFDPDGRTVVTFGPKLKVVTHLGDLAELREMAAAAG